MYRHLPVFGPGLAFQVDSALVLAPLDDSGWGPILASFGARAKMNTLAHCALAHAHAHNVHDVAVFPLLLEASLDGVLYIFRVAIAFAAAPVAVPRALLVSLLRIQNSHSPDTSTLCSNSP